VVGNDIHLSLKADLGTTRPCTTEMTVGRGGIATATLLKDDHSYLREEIKSAPAHLRSHFHYCRWTDLGTTNSGLGPQSQYVSCAGSKTPNGFEACGVAGDVCLEDGICHYTHPEANGSGFYLAGCTDPAYQDSSCQQQCGKTNDSEYACSGETVNSGH
jgi:hypothetical protein